MGCQGKITKVGAKETRKERHAGGARIVHATRRLSQGLSGNTSAFCRAWDDLLKGEEYAVQRPHLPDLHPVVGVYNVFAPGQPNGGAALCISGEAGCGRLAAKSTNAVSSSSLQALSDSVKGEPRREELLQ